VLGKDSTTSQHDTIMGFPRFFNMVIEWKLALLRPALPMDDPFNRWAAESILRRGCHNYLLSLGERLTTWQPSLPRWLLSMLPAAPSRVTPFLLSSGKWW